MARHRILIAREQYKFACAHMTVFPDGSKERLHGHNYTVALAIEVDRVDLAAMIPFATIKQVIRELCEAWNERVLVAERNPHLQILRDDSELEFTLCGQRYAMPRGDALLLPIDNITVEALAAHVADRIGPRIATFGARSLEVTVNEHPGQGAACRLELAS